MHCATAKLCAAMCDGKGLAAVSAVAVGRRGQQYQPQDKRVRGPLKGHVYIISVYSQYIALGPPRHFCGYIDVSSYFHGVIFFRF